MSEVSANYFFNFSKKLEYLVETIKHGAFSPRYNCEDFSYIHPSFGAARKFFILMKCFCDIPFNHLMRSHIKTYGEYGIGLKKSWGINNNLTPVHYIPKADNSTWYPNNLSSLYSLVFTQESDSQIRDLITNYFIYTKPYEKDGTVFYNEREWRYIPPIDYIKKIRNEDLRIRHYIILPNQYTDDLGDLSGESNKLKNNEHIRLKFDLKDVKYVIVKGCKDVRKIRKMIKGNSDIEIKKASDFLNT